MKGFATIAKPLHHLTEKMTKFDWTNEAERAFQEIQHILLTVQWLVFQDYSKPFILDTDAGEYGLEQCFHCAKRMNQNLLLLMLAEFSPGLNNVIASSNFVQIIDFLPGIPISKNQRVC